MRSTNCAARSSCPFACLHGSESGESSTRRRAARGEGCAWPRHPGQRFPYARLTLQGRRLRCVVSASRGKRVQLTPWSPQAANNCSSLAERRASSACSPRSPRSPRSHALPRQDSSPRTTCVAAKPVPQRARIERLCAITVSHQLRFPQPFSGQPWLLAGMRGCVCIKRAANFGLVRAHLCCSCCLVTGPHLWGHPVSVGGNTRRRPAAVQRATALLWLVTDGAHVADADLLVSAATLKVAWGTR